MGPSGAPASLKNRTPNEKALGKPGLLRLYSSTTSEPMESLGGQVQQTGSRRQRRKRSPLVKSAGLAAATATTATGHGIRGE